MKTLLARYIPRGVHTRTLTPAEAEREVSARPGFWRASIPIEEHLLLASRRQQLVNIAHLMLRNTPGASPRAR